MLVLALVMAAATPQPWVEMAAGPMLLRESGRSGVGSGPLVRLDVGYPFGERFAAELWLSGAMPSSASGPLGDSALVGGGAGGRALLTRFGGEGKLALWAHAGAGWGLAAAGEGQPGPTGFAGAMLAFQPFIKRFTLALEADGVAYRNAFGVALLPSLRCSF